LIDRQKDPCWSFCTDRSEQSLDVFVACIVRKVANIQRAIGSLLGLATTAVAGVFGTIRSAIKSALGSAITVGAVRGAIIGPIARTVSARGAIVRTVSSVHGTGLCASVTCRWLGVKGPHRNGSTVHDTTVEDLPGLLSFGVGFELHKSKSARSSRGAIFRE
jgi:hypothetical protein